MTHPLRNVNRHVYKHPASEAEADRLFSAFVIHPEVSVDPNSLITTTTSINSQASYELGKASLSTNVILRIMYLLFLRSDNYIQENHSVIPFWSSG